MVVAKKKKWFFPNIALLIKDAAIFGWGSSKALIVNVVVLFE